MVEPVELEVLLAGCAEEPIHVPEAVQPFGALLAVDDAGTLQVASDGADAVLGAPVRLGRPLAELLGDDLAARCRVGGAPFQAELLGAGAADVATHRSGALSLIEIEPVGVTPLPSDELISLQRPLWRARTLHELLDATVREVRELTGFDRVMAYRFDDEWNGEVVAEARAASLRPYLGLHYPASDIPPQARELYRRNPSRLIADVAYRPSPLRHLDRDRTAPLDLSDSTLRSVSPVHLQYLRTMGVAASMSLSLLVDGRLWGLVACHHERAPHRPDPSRRRAASSLAELAAALVVTVTEAESLSDRLIASERVGALHTRIDEADDPLEALTADTRLLGLVDAVGAVVSIDGRTASVGRARPAAQAALDAAALLAEGVDCADTDELAGPGPDLVGALAVALGEGGRSWVVWYRPELVHEIRWAGDPHGDEVVTEPDGRVHLGPRRSFATFVESVTGRSPAWGPSERWAARELSSHVRATLTRRTHERLTASSIVQRALLSGASLEASGFDVAVRYLPAQGDPIGGDWHDVFHLPDGAAAFVVGDTVGHGVEVAGIMAQLRSALRAYLVSETSPAVALDRMGELVQQLLPGQMATAVVGVVDPSTGRVRVASAGHLPPLVVGSGGARALEVPNGPALGFRRAGPSRTVETVLGAGEGLVLFSDGLVEHRDVPVPEAVQQLGEALAGGGARAPWPPPGGAAELCERALSLLGGRAADDDLTVLASLRSPAGRG